METRKLFIQSEALDMFQCRIVLNEWKCLISVLLSSGFSADVLHPRWTHSSNYCAVLAVYLIIKHM